VFFIGYCLVHEWIQINSDLEILYVHTVKPPYRGSCMRVKQKNAFVHNLVFSIS
jgi:hypothetical protein